MHKKITRSLLLSLLFGCIGLYSCTPSSEPIQFGHDACHYCKMTIVEQKFGAELVTKKGKVYKYDAIECMINELYQDKNFAEEDISLFLTVNYTSPGALLDAKKVHFLKCENIPSPMGMYLSGFETREAADSVREKEGGTVLSWDNTISFVINSPN